MENELFADANRWKWNSSDRECDIQQTRQETTTALRKFVCMYCSYIHRAAVFAIKYEHAREKQANKESNVCTSQRFHGNRIHFSSLALKYVRMSVFNFHSMSATSDTHMYVFSRLASLLQSDLGGPDLFFSITSILLASIEQCEIIIFRNYFLILLLV